MVNLYNKNIKAYCLGFVDIENEKMFVVTPLSTTTHKNLFFESEKTAHKYVSKTQKHPHIFNGFNIAKNNYVIKYVVDDINQTICCGIDAILLPSKTTNMLNYVEESNNLLDFLNKLNDEKILSIVYDNNDCCFMMNDDLKTCFGEIDLNTPITSGVYKNIIANVNGLNGVPVAIINIIN